MTNKTPAVETAVAYHRAWTNRDMNAAMSFIADELNRVDATSPAGTS